MNGQNTVSGIVLAGGMGRRMQQQDKGLVLFKHQPLVSYAIAALSPLVDELLISANRNQERYRQFGYQVISDDNGNFDGPLAGILAAMQHARHATLLIMPCDSPLIGSQHLQRLLDQLGDDTEIAAAFDGQRLHPVVAAIKTNLRGDLQAYLQRGERRLEQWFNSRRLLKVDFSDVPEVFANINTLQHLQELEAQTPVS
jgi:molybdopterin-guanine dinucleotide biosynthesis protein A